MASLRCPTCGHFFESDYALAMPFCSERCRQIDLGNWLDEQYSVPLDIDAVIEEEGNQPQGSRFAQDDEDSEE